MTVSPAMWVTGNMASNMSLKMIDRKKETEMENTVVINIHAFVMHYLASNYSNLPLFKS